MSADAVAELIARGALIPVQVFGGVDYDSNGEEVPWGYGLCDRFSKHTVGSDCNRAAFFLLRPSDDLMDNPVVRAALDAVLERPQENPWEPGERRGHVVTLPDEPAAS